MKITKSDDIDGCGSVVYRVRGTDYALRMEGEVMLVNLPEWLTVGEVRRTAAILLEVATDMDAEETE